MADQYRDMLTETTPVRDAVRSFNKHALNPAMMYLAGRRYWYAAVVRHTGRQSGRHYATPVVADRVTDGFIVPLPYGTRVDWLRNVQASGTAAVTAGGHTYDVIEPEIIDAATAGPQLSPLRRRVFEALGIAKFVKLRAAGS